MCNTGPPGVRTADATPQASPGGPVQGDVRPGCAAALCAGQGRRPA